MKRRLFTILSALSLLIFMAVCVLWVRGLSRYEMWEYQTSADKLYHVVSVHGDIYFSAVDRSPSIHAPVGFKYSGAKAPAHWDSWHASTPKPNVARRMLGVGFIRFEYGVKLVLACWLLSASCMVLPTLWMSRYVRERLRTARGLCPSCGYDLRATPERCPECGHAATPPRP